MKYLAIDTSGKHITVVANNNGKIAKEFESDCGVKHSVSLMNKVEQAIEKTGLNLQEVDFFAVVVGAGSFTGIRIGVATIKAFCLAYNKKALSITSFDTIAYNSKENKVMAVIDAGHGGYYVCGYNDKVVDFSPAYILKDELKQLEKEYKLLSFEEIKDFNTEKEDVLEGLILAIESLCGNVESAENITPLYIRKSQAEENR